MASGFATNRDVMMAASGKISAAVNDVQAQRTALANATNELLTGWATGASTVFSQAHAAFDSELAKLITALNGIHETVTKNAVNYGASDEASTSAVNSVASALNVG